MLNIAAGKHQCFVYLLQSEMFYVYITETHLKMWCHIAYLIYAFNNIFCWTLICSPTSCGNNVENINEKKLELLYTLHALISDWLWYKIYDLL